MTHKRLIYTILTLFLFYGTMVSAQHNIKIKIKNLANTKVQLAYYFNDKQFVQDTAVTNENGQAVFKGDEALPGGLYLLIIPQNKYFDFLVADDQEFTLSTDTGNFIKKMRVSGSAENKLFFEYQNFVIGKNEERKELQSQLKNKETDSLQRIEIEGKIKRVNETMEGYWKKIVEENSGSFMANLLKGMNGERPEGYSKAHFFDHIEFSDARLLRTPIIHRAVRVVIARNMNKKFPPEHVIEEIELMVSKASANDDVKHYILNHFLNFFSTFPRIGMNRVFVHIVDKYYKKDENDWMDDKSLEQIAERAAKLRSNFVGEIAPELKLEKPSEEYVSLHQVEAKYTLLLFWTVGCGHCEEAIEEIKEFMAVAKGYSVEVFAIYTQDDKKKWQDFIEKHKIDWTNCWDPENISNYRELYTVYSTPIMYLLDKDKKIKSLSVGPDKIKNLLLQLE